MTTTNQAAPSIADDAEFITLLNLMWKDGSFNFGKVMKVQQALYAHIDKRIAAERQEEREQGFIDGLFHAANQQSGSAQPVELAPLPDDDEMVKWAAMLPELTHSTWTGDSQMNYHGEPYQYTTVET